MSQTTITQLQQQYALVHEQPVAWGEMDAFNHVNNVVYYRYIENARIMYLHAIKALQYPELYVVVHSNNCKYLRPVTYPDTLYIGVKVTDLRNSSFTMSYDIYSKAQNTLVAQAEAVIVSVSSETHGKYPLPDELKKSIETYGNIDAS